MRLGGLDSLAQSILPLRHRFKDKIMRIVVRRVHLDRGGYTKSGRYYGTGPRLYECDLEESPGKCPVASFETRASDPSKARELAKAHFQKIGMLSELKTSGKKLPSDYEECGYCGFDHDYEPRESYN